MRGASHRTVPIWLGELAQTSPACPATGVDKDSVLKYSGKGDVGLRSGPDGDLYITFAVGPPSTSLVRRGLDLYSQVTEHPTDSPCSQRQGSCHGTC